MLSLLKKSVIHRVKSPAVIGSSIQLVTGIHLIGDDQTSGITTLVGASGTTNWNSSVLPCATYLQPTLNNHYAFELYGSGNKWTPVTAPWIGAKNILVAGVWKKFGATPGNSLQMDCRNTGTGDYLFMLSNGIDNVAGVTNRYYYTDSSPANQTIDINAGDVPTNFAVRIWDFNQNGGVKLYINGGAPKSTGTAFYCNAPAQFLMGTTPSNFYSQWFMELFYLTYPPGNANLDPSTLEVYNSYLGTKYNIAVTTITT